MLSHRQTLLTIYHEVLICSLIGWDTMGPTPKRKQHGEGKKRQRNGKYWHEMYFQEALCQKSLPTVLGLLCLPWGDQTLPGGGPHSPKAQLSARPAGTSASGRHGPKLPRSPSSTLGCPLSALRRPGLVKGPRARSSGQGWASSLAAPLLQGRVPTTSGGKSSANSSVAGPGKSAFARPAGKPFRSVPQSSMTWGGPGDGCLQTLGQPGWPTPPRPWSQPSPETRPPAFGLSPCSPGPC